jgi:surfeit locus 1 family protein
MAALRFYFPALLTLAMLAVLVSLGFWQVERLVWKQELLARIAMRQADRPLILNSAALADLQRKNDAYRRAVLRGRFGPQTGFWFTQIENKPNGLPSADKVGYHALSPFFLADGGVLLIDRGFVPSRLKDSLSPPATKPQTLEVILRWPDQRGVFDNDDKPHQALFYVRDPQALGAHWGLALPAVIGERADIGLGWPRGGQTRMKIANNHLQYAVTWFGLAIVLVIISGLWHIRFWKNRQQ